MSKGLADSGPRRGIARKHPCPAYFAGHHRVRRKAYGCQVGKAQISPAAVGLGRPTLDRLGSNIGLPPMLRCAKPRPLPTLAPIQLLD
jgi:hypothetical protein